MNSKSSSGSNDTSNSTIQTQETSYFSNNAVIYEDPKSSFGNTSAHNTNINVYKRELPVASPTQPAIFTPFQNNWTRSATDNNVSLQDIFPTTTTSPYQQFQQAPYWGGQSSAGNYKNIDSLNLDFKNMSTAQQNVTSDEKTSAKPPSALGSDSRAPLAANTIHKLRFEIKEKDEYINSLQVEIKYLKDTISSLQSSQSKLTDMPINHFKLFKRLASNLQVLQKKFDESEHYLESLLTALSLSPQQQIVTDTGRFDAEELAHKIVNKMKLLEEENTEMLRMLSFGRSKQKDIELALLRERVAELEGSQERETCQTSTSSDTDK